MRNIKLIVLHILKFSGFFLVFRIATKNQIRILCYHGVELRNETLFRPAQFIKPKTLDMRMRYLSDGDYELTSLDDYNEVNLSYIKPRVIITVDDGFYSSYKYFIKVSNDYGFPITLYVTTYYCDKNVPIFGLLVQYYIWHLEDVGGWSFNEIVEKIRPLLTKEPETISDVLNDIILQGERLRGEDARVNLLRALGDLIDVSFDEINESKIFTLMSYKEILNADNNRIDIQLHTHRHRFPESVIEASAEIEENREILNRLLKKSFQHFCYPSGIWLKLHFQVLKKCGIKTATTCEPGLNKRGNNNCYALRRILDGEHMTQIEFEAELAGVMDFFRMFKNTRVNIIN